MSRPTESEMESLVLRATQRASGATIHKVNGTLGILRAIRSRTHWGAEQEALWKEFKFELESTLLSSSSTPRN